MSNLPTRRRGTPEVTEEDKRIIRERLETYEEDKQSAVNAREALAEIRRSLKSPGNSRNIS